MLHMAMVERTCFRTGELWGVENEALPKEAALLAYLRHAFCSIVCKPQGTSIRRRTRARPQPKGSVRTSQMLP